MVKVNILLNDILNNSTFCCIEKLELHTKLSMEYENELTLSILQSLGYIKQTIKSKNHSTCNR